MARWNEPDFDQWVKDNYRRMFEIAQRLPASVKDATYDELCEYDRDYPEIVEMIKEELAGNAKALAEFEELEDYCENVDNAEFQGGADPYLFNFICSDGAMTPEEFESQSY